MPFGEPNFITQVVNLLIAGFLGMIGSVASFFYEIDKGRRKFTLLGMFFVSVVGFVIGTTAGAFIPTGENWHGWTLVVGLNAYPILGAMKERSASVIDKIAGIISR
tara:strand:- start:61 stop:378 length:318 start_codon:yes stop_codon:yes gene_type:complete